MKIKNLIILVAILTAQISANAAPRPYFTGDKISPELIPAPYKAGSKESKAEIVQVIKSQKSAGKKDIKKAAAEVELTSEMIVLDIDKNLTRKSHPALYNLLDRVSATASVSAENAKKFYKTQRPYSMDKNIKNLVNREKNYGYPSKHTTESFILARVLSFLMPEKQKQFNRRAEEVAQHSIITGTHFPKDIAGGKELANLIFNKLEKNLEFNRDANAARLELNK